MYSIKKKKFIILIIITALIGAFVSFALTKALLGSGHSQPVISGSEDQESEDVRDRFEDLEEVYQRILKDYYKDVDPEKLITGAAKGMVDSLGDKYSSYMTKDEYDQWLATITGEYEGIGVTFVMDKKGEGLILLVAEGSPAEKAGLKPKDVIIRVNGKKYTDANLMSGAIRGEEGTSVKITYRRNGKKKTVSITRDKIISKTVDSRMLDGNIGYIQILAFEAKTYDDFRKVLDSMEKKKVKGLVIDLRDNGGGLVDPATKVADDLLGKCNITYLQDREGKKEYIDSDASKTDLPYVLLVNGNTASASEIITAAIKDNKGGKIVGTKTYGKGIVQNTEKLADGSALELTILQYFSPNGHAIHKKGIKPNYVVKNKPKTKTDEQLVKAEELLR